MLKNKTSGFSYVEIIAVMVILAVLGLISVSTLSNSKNKGYYSRSYVEMQTFQQAIKLYVEKYNDYPPDGAQRGIPNGLQEFIAKQSNSPDWPKAPYPNSVYDYDLWTDPVDNSQITQISIRFCDVGEADSTCKPKIPKEPFTNSSWDNNSAMYWCIKGKCRSHISEPLNHPGYCMNCVGSPRYYQ